MNLKFQSFQKPVPHQSHVSRDISNPALEMLFLVVSNMFIIVLRTGFCESVTKQAPIQSSSPAAL